jgi:hypothetical protein
LLPVAVTILAFLTVGIFTALSFYPRSGFLWWILDFSQILVFAALWGAVPYGVVAIAISIWLRKPRAHYSRVLVFTPLAVIVVGEGLMALTSLAAWNVKPMRSYFYAVATFIFGYAYVAIIWTAHKIATRQGWVVSGT